MDQSRHDLDRRGSLVPAAPQRGGTRSPHGRRAPVQGRAGTGSAGQPRGPRRGRRARRSPGGADAAHPAAAATAEPLAARRRRRLAGRVRRPGVGAAGGRPPGGHRGRRLGARRRRRHAPRCLPPGTAHGRRRAGAAGGPGVAGHRRDRRHRPRPHRRPRAAGVRCAEQRRSRRRPGGGQRPGQDTAAPRRPPAAAPPPRPRRVTEAGITSSPPLPQGHPDRRALTPPGAGAVDLLSAELSVPGSQPTAHSAQVDGTLHGIVQAAIETTGATYGALGVLDDTGAAYERFVVVGMDAATRERIGRPPVGAGVVGLLLGRSEPVRLDDLTTHPEAVGFPPGHPPMRSFLGVPVRVRGAVFGHLFVTAERVDAFTDADQAAAVGLAAAGGLAIGNAELVERAEHRRAWAQAGTDIATALLSGADPDTVLRSIGEQVADLASADAAGVLVPSPDDENVLTVVVAVGAHYYEYAEGVRLPLTDTDRKSVV